MMSSETSIKAPADNETRADALQPWQLFTLAGLAAATAVVFVAKETTPAAIVILSLTVACTAWLGLAAWRTLAPLFGIHRGSAVEVLGGRTRAALEREKVLVLRAIKDLEFDRAMGKVAEKDFADMSARLRARAARLLQQLDRGAGYRDEIERELARRVGAPPAAGKPAAVAAGAAPDVAAVSVKSCACGAANDLDARFCKRCGSRLEAA